MIIFTLNSASFSLKTQKYSRHLSAHYSLARYLQNRSTYKVYKVLPKKRCIVTKALSKHSVVLGTKEKSCIMLYAYRYRSRYVKVYHSIEFKN
jgi:hypothetical protein